ncbi:MAG: hypothetical protein A2Y41_14400 [Spirochaetes bacterium GWB1_36_13]|nr:MAG: hypothetical protein A2Y41_14400 [Spirochaetes bacterium GWB1_36_13]
MASENGRKNLAFYINPNIETPFNIIEKGGVRSKNINDVRNITFPKKLLLKIVPEDFIDPSAYDRQDYAKIHAGRFVYYDESDQGFYSQIYGYAVLKGSKISVEPLVEITKDKLRASIYYIPNKFGEYPSVEHIRQTFIETKLKGYLGDEKINYQIDDLKKQGKKLGILTIAKGVTPENGQIEHYILLKEVGKKVGKVLEGGRIDYKEQNAFTPVMKGEEILERKPLIQPKDGFDVLGNMIKGVYLGEKIFIPGRNLEESKEKPGFFTAAVNGVISIVDRKVSVDNKVVIRKDINLESGGNLDLEGSVEIYGNVKSGFEVKATGDIIIHGNVEDAVILAGNDIVIDNGVLGKEKARIKAGNNIVIRFAQNTHFYAGKNITVKESMIQCTVFAKNTVIIEGTVVGGEITGKHGVMVKVAGSDKGVETRLTAGVDPEVQRKIKDKEEEKKMLEGDYTEHLEDIKMQFGNQFLIDLKGFLSVLRGSRKIKFIEMLTKLGNLTKEVNRVKNEIVEVRKEIAFDKPPVIEVLEKVFADVIVLIRRSQPRRIQKAKSGTTFKEDPETGIIIEL